MRKLFIALLLIFPVFLFAQDSTSSGFAATPKFLPGETKTYQVVESYKILDAKSKAKSSYRVSFSVLDTIGGITISYKVLSVETSNKNAVVQSVIAKICDGIELKFSFKKRGWIIHPKSYFECQSQVTKALDSILGVDHFSKLDLKSLQIIRRNLDEPEGIAIALSPLMNFNHIFVLPLFRKQKDYRAASQFNILGQPTVGGTMITKLDKIDPDKNYVNLSMEFIGNRESAARYFWKIYHEVYAELSGKNPSYLPDEMKFNTESEYQLFLSSSWPVSIKEKRTERYMVSTVTNFEMKLVE